MLGDAAGARAFRARADAIAGERPPTAMRWNCGVYDTGVAMLEGRFDDAAALARDTADARPARRAPLRGRGARAATA